MRKKTSIVPYLLMTPAFCMLFFFIVYPMIVNIFISFLRYDLTQIGRPFVGIKNYISIIQDPRIWAAVQRTFVWTFINLTFMLLLGLGAAILLSTGFSGNTFMKGVILIPWILPSVITGYTWALMLSEDAGIITWMMKSLGLVSSSFSWFQSGPLAMTAAIFANIWRGFPFFALMLFAKISGLPTDHREAATLEGASHGQMFRFITFPFIRPVIASCTFLAFIWTFNAYDILKVMTNGGPAELTTTMSLLVQKEAFQYYSLSNASTMSVIMFILMLTIIYFFKVLSRILIRFQKRGGHHVIAS